MIEMIKSNRITFWLKIDIQGIEELLIYINGLNGKSRKYPQILYLGKERKLEIELDTEIDELLIGKDVIKLYMDEEELEYLEERLKDALISRCFYPAEMCGRTYKNRNVYIYCEIVFSS
ncbi:MAG: hypothetical protein HDR00_14245 [Lachnospiraceae bacterium]|nr:hypothetical protein [Lachnospiraceae bacterium]